MAIMIVKFGGQMTFWSCKYKGWSMGNIDMQLHVLIGHGLLVLVAVYPRQLIWLMSGTFTLQHKYIGCFRFHNLVEYFSDLVQPNSS